MGKINLSRVILGGIVAGIVIDIFEGVLNGVVLSGQWTEAMSALGRTAAMSAKQIAAFNVWGLVVGIVLIGLYAAMRPRFGAGPRTAMLAGAAVWALANAASNAAMVFLHLFPLGLMLEATAFGLVEMLLAGMAGAAVYKEEAVVNTRASSARA
ncbi:MAG TPA: hypothetical protein VGJ09_19740 [Bryobacteraceae bacterium]